MFSDEAPLLRPTAYWLAIRLLNTHKYVLFILQLWILRQGKVLRCDPDPRCMMRYEFIHLPETAYAI